jgi:HAD superfamily hydrolase (TIGR01484 family)
MRYHVLACDFDETIADGGQVADATLAALQKVSRSGRKLILVTGRELDHLLADFPHTDLFTLVVAENGALLYDPADRSRHELAEPPPAAFVERLRAEGVSPLGVGQVIVATREPYEGAVLEAVRELGLELQVVRNKGAVMVLPSGVNKATGLVSALDRLNLSPHNVVAVGDAENDHAFLTAAECGAAVANAVPALKESADLPLSRERGEGVAELTGLLLDTDLAEAEIARWHVLLGHRGEEEVRLAPYGTGLVVAGPSGSGKSTAVTALLERLTRTGYQCCVIDPEGDYAEYPGANVHGDPDRPPSVEEVLRLLEAPRQHAVVNMIGVPLRDRPAFFGDLLPRLAGLRSRLGHPHWVVVDEAHHLMPAELSEVPIAAATEVGSLVMVTVHPEALSPAALRLVDDVIAVGEAPEKTLGAFAGALSRTAPHLADEPGDLALWHVGADEAIRLQLLPAEMERTRHRRKYAAGTMSKGKSFYFTGPAKKLRLRARNLHAFVELAEGVDEDTWLHHLGSGDYSEWVRDSIGDDELADELAEVESLSDPDAQATRTQITDLINERYTLPAEPTHHDPDHDD